MHVIFQRDNFPFFSFNNLCVHMRLQRMTLLRAHSPEYPTWFALGKQNVQAKEVNYIID